MGSQRVPPGVQIGWLAWAVAFWRSDRWPDGSTEELARELLVEGELNGGGSEHDMGSCLASISRSPPPFYVHRYPLVAAVNVCTFWRTLLAGDSADGLHSPQG